MGTKTCTTCFVRKNLETEFYKHAQMADGYLNKCKECVKSRVRKHRDQNIEYFRKYDKKRYLEQPQRKENARQSRKNWIAKNPTGPTVVAREWRKRNPEKYKAHLILNNALRNKTIIREGCKVCGGKAHAHHEDYAKPLEVVWLCPVHHSELHRVRRA